jgi:hypothetical protein
MMAGMVVSTEVTEVTGVTVATVASMAVTVASSNYSTHVTSSMGTTSY